MRDSLQTIIRKISQFLFSRTNITKYQENEMTIFIWPIPKLEGSVKMSYKFTPTKIKIINLWDVELTGNLYMELDSYIGKEHSHLTYRSKKDFFVENSKEMSGEDTKKFWRKIARALEGRKLKEKK